MLGASGVNGTSSLETSSTSAMNLVAHTRPVTAMVVPAIVVVMGLDLTKFFTETIGFNIITPFVRGYNLIIGCAFFAKKRVRVRDSLVNYSLLKDNSVSDCLY